MNSSRAQNAFSLIELLVVLVLIGLLAGLVAVSLESQLGQVRMTEVLDRVKRVDARARLNAVRDDQPQTLRFDMVAGTIERMSGDGMQQDQGRLVHMPDGFSIESLKRRGTDTNESLEAAISINRDGWSQSYALAIANADSNGQDQWLVMAGLTGASWIVDDEQEATQLLATANGPDTD